MKKMDGKSAIVTGAAMGNGLGIARVLAKHGAKTVLADISEQVFQAADDFFKKETNPNNPEDVIQGIAGGVPLGRLGKIEEVGELAAFLASDESSYISGTQIVIDGGSTLPEVSVGV